MPRLMLKEIPDGCIVYALTGTGGGDGDSQTKYPGFDLGLQKGGHEPVKVFRLESDGVEDSGTFVDVTKEARSLTSSLFDAIRLADVQYDALYIMSHEKFTGIEVSIQTAGVGAVTCTWEYPNAVDSELNPSAWVDLAEEDNTTEFTVGTGAKTCKWIAPSDWVKSKIEGFEGYWVKFMIGTPNYSTAPILQYVKTVISNPALSINIPGATVDDACDFHPNSTLTAGSVIDKQACPVSTSGIDLGSLAVHNFALKKLANTQICSIIAKGDIGVDFT